MVLRIDWSWEDEEERSRRAFMDAPLCLRGCEHRCFRVSTGEYLVMARAGLVSCGVAGALGLETTGSP